MPFYLCPNRKGIGTQKQLFSFFSSQTAVNAAFVLSLHILHRLDLLLISNGNLHVNQPRQNKGWEKQR